MSSDISLKQILVPLDGSDLSFQAAKYAIEIARMVKAEIIFTHVVANPPYIEYKGAGLVLVHYVEEAKRQAEMWYVKAGDMASKYGVRFSTETLLDVVSVADAIASYADRKKVDMIVMGTKGRTGFKRFLLGSVASGVVSHAKCSVLVVR
jgi:nucleotide-binding universal stress UspA family protein